MAASRPSRVPGFFATVWLFRSKVFFSWDFGFAVAAAVASVFLPPDKDLPDAAAALTPVAVGLAAALVGVVVAALAVVVVFFDDDFLILIDDATRDRGGMEGQLFPYWFVTATGIAAVLTSTALMLVATSEWLGVTRALFVISIGFLVWTAVGVFNLVAYLQSVGVSRAIFVRKRRDQRQQAAGRDDESGTAPK